MHLAPPKLTIFTELRGCYFGWMLWIPITAFFSFLLLRCPFSAVFGKFFFSFLFARAKKTFLWLKAVFWKLFQTFSSNIPPLIFSPLKEVPPSSSTKHFLLEKKTGIQNRNTVTKNAVYQRSSCQLILVFLFTKHAWLICFKLTQKKRKNPSK